MKNKYRIILTAILLVPFSIMAQTSNLVVFSDSDLFYLSLNGIKQNAAPVTNIKVTDIPKESNSIYIMFADESKGTVSKNMTFLDMGVEITTKVMLDKKGRYKVKFFGEVPVSESKNTSGQFVTSYQTVDAVVAPTPTTTQVTTTQTTTENIDVASTISTTIPNDESTKSSGEKVDLQYKWTAGSTHSFSIVQVDEVTTSIMGMKMTDEFITTTDFSIFIDEVNSKGTASGEIYLSDYKVIDSKKRTLASLSDLPQKAIKSQVQIDAKGRFKFTNKLKLIKTSNGSLITYTKADNNRITGGGKNGNITVEAYVEFDPKTGAIKAGGSIKEDQPTKEVSIKIDEETNEMDVLPYDYLAMLELPNGSIAQGDKAKVTAGVYTINIEAATIDNGKAVLNYKFGTDKSKNMMNSSASTETTDGSMMMEVPAGDMAQPMMSSDEKAALSSAKAMIPNVSGDMNATFDYQKGMFDLVNGKMITELNIMGMKMTVNSSVTMKKN